MASVNKGRRLMGEINVVPYIDVMLVLLIIFMITAPLLTQGIKVDLPKAGAEPLDPKMLKNAIPIVLSVDREGQLFLNKGGNPREPLDPDVVRDRTAQELKGNPDLPVLVKADDAVPYGKVVRAMVVLQKAGAKKVGFITDPLPQPTPRRGGH
jgi:biopolymer transport protein TolR